MTRDGHRKAGPPPLPANRDPGDAWAVGPDGTRYWGAFGAAGLVLADPDGRVLLQHRAEWSHHGGTWGIPGGALHQGEDAVTGAVREAAEEAGVPEDAVTLRATFVLDLGFWSYTTVIADTPGFTAVPGDAESLALEWVPADMVDHRALHPGFEAAWAQLRTVLAARPAIVIDVANVLGSRPNGWWRDRAGASTALLQELAHWAGAGIDAGAWSLPGDRCWVTPIAVVEGRARGALDSPGVDVIRAAGSGDDEIVDQVRSLVAQGRDVTVITSDRELVTRVTREGATSHGARWLLDAVTEVADIVRANENGHRPPQ